MPLPEALKKGDKIGIVAPAGILDQVLLEKGLERIRKLGFEITLGKHVLKSCRYLAGTDEERAEDLQRMFEEDVRAILCTRGGYGSSRLIPYLNEKSLAGSRKIFIGCSDLTTLLLYFNKLRVPVFHGPMVSHFARSEDVLTGHYFITMLTSKVPSGLFSYPSVEILKKGVAEGEAVGGCLSLLCASIGTSYEIQTEGKILFIEEINEPPYRIDRMLMQLKLAGKFKNVKGILFGTLVNCDPPAGSAYTLEEVILSCIGDLDCPVLYGLPIGHGRENVTIPLGIKIRINGNHGTVTFLESAVR